MAQLLRRGHRSSVVELLVETIDHLTDESKKLPATSSFGSNKTENNAKKVSVLKLSAQHNMLVGISAVHTIILIK